MEDNDALAESLEAKAAKITEELGGSTVTFRRRRYLQGQLDQIISTLRKLAKSNGSSKDG